MYKLMIVDDEDIIRNGLKKHMDWENLGFNVVCLLEDGCEAISYLQSNHVDVILSDIKMYDVSGIDLARHVSENYPTIKMVLFSGYKEFDYAMNAIKYGACDYVLKPIVTEELASVFAKIRNVLDCEKNTVSGSVMHLSLFEGAEYHEILSCCNTLVEAISTGNTGLMYVYHQKLIEFMHNKPNEFVFFVITKLIDDLYMHLDQTSFNLPDSLQKNIFFARMNYTNADILLSQAGELFNMLCDYLSKKKEDTRKSLIIRAKKYINDNLSSDFSSEEVAKNIFVSSGYLSRLFKNITGQNIIDYIIKCRINRAIELIREGRYSTKEVSEMVGYNNVDYFHKSFRKHTGYTVKQIQSLML